MNLNEFQKNLQLLFNSISGEDKFKTLGEMVIELKSLLEHLATTDKQAAEKLLSDLESTKGNSLFMEVGKLLRRFHDQLMIIKEAIPDNLGRLSNEEVVEMSERLQMVVAMTDKAANKTLDLAEQLMETVTLQTNSLNDISISLDAMLKHEKLPQPLTESLKTTMKQVKDLVSQQNDIQAKLSEILITQDYQDLTGQVILKVINLLKSLEIEMAKLVDRFGKTLIETKKPDDVVLKGPLSEADEAKKSQDDVDLLLTKFGF